MHQVVNASYAVAVGYVAWDVYSVVKAEEKVEGGNMTRAVPLRYRAASLIRNTPSHRALGIVLR